MTTTMGVDVGASSVKTVLARYGNGEAPEILYKDCRRMHRRNPAVVAEESMNDALAVGGLRYDEVDYIASTGEGEMVKRKRGHFYSMTCHARGAVLRRPQAGIVAGRAEFERAPAVERTDVGIDPVRERRRDRFRVRGVDGPFRIPVAAEPDRSGQGIPFDCPRPEDLGQLPRPDASPQVDLKQAVARDDVALGEEQVVLCLGVDVRNAPAVPKNLHAILEAGEGDLFQRCAGDQAGQYHESTQQFPHG